MEKVNDKKFMETESIPKLLARFAAPALIGMLASALYNIVDRIFVGQTVGTPGIAAIALAFPCMLFFFSMAFLIGVGSASRVSILLGEKKQERAEQTLGNSTTFALVVGIILWIGSRAAFRPILLLSGASETLYPAAASYLSIILYGIVFSILSFSLSCQIRACGSPTYAMGTQVVGAAANIVLDAYFVIVLKKGVEGAAVATVISQAISTLWTLAYFRLPGAKLRLRLRYMLKIDPTTILRIIAVGTPACLVNLNFVFVHGLITNASNSYGGDIAVSATGIFMSLDSLLFMPAVAIGEASQPIIGYNYGAMKYDRVVKVVKNGVIATTVFYLISFCAIMLFAEYLVMMFNSDDQELIALTAKAMRVANIGIPLMGLSIINTSLLQGLGKGTAGLVLAFSRFALFLWIPLLLLPPRFGVFGAWGSFPISDIGGSILSALFMIYWIKKLNKGPNLGAPPQTPLGTQSPDPGL